MNSMITQRRTVTLAAAVLLAAGTTWAQSPGYLDRTAPPAKKLTLRSGVKTPAATVSRSTDGMSSGATIPGRTKMPSGYSLAGYAQSGPASETPTPPPAAPSGSTSTSSPMAAAVENGGCDSCGVAGEAPCASGCGGGFYGGGDYLFVRPHMSQAIAFFTETTANDGLLLVDQAVPFDFGYDSSFRAFMGYRLNGDGCNPGGAFQFTYWHFEGDAGAEFTIPPRPPLVQAIDIFSRAASIPGELMRARMTLETNVYDFDFIKPVRFGGSSCATSGCETSGCATNACAPCPTWEIAWSIGARLADIDQDYAVGFLDTESVCQGVGTVAAEFIGAGPRLGLEGRRYFGCSDCFSLFAKGNAALLVGNYGLATHIDNTSSGAQTYQDLSVTRTIPVTEIEVGGTWKPVQCATFSAGWMFQSWLDLGMTEATAGNQFNQRGLDTANNLSFDGFFARAEVAF
jgi:hypothetical protein